jgi:hypothetical protein
MTAGSSGPDASPPAPGRFAWLERLTGGVLFAVVLALGWILVAASQPEWVGWPSTAVQVSIILVLLVVALLLVSTVALLHTRG